MNWSWSKTPRKYGAFYVFIVKRDAIASGKKR
jgi:hypothetical protein